MSISRPITMRSFLEKEFPNMVSLWGDKLLVSGSKALITGKAGAKKSFLAMCLAIAFSANEHDGQFLDQPIACGKKVMYFNFEISEQMLQERFMVMMSNYEHRNLNNLFVSTTFDFRVEDDTDRSNIVNYIMQYQPDVIFFDCMYKMHNMDENSEQDMKKIINLLDIFVSKGITVILVHHQNKNNRQERGSSVIKGWAETQIDIDKRGIIEFTKIRNAPEPDPIKVEFGSNLWFKTVGSETAPSTRQVTDDLIISIIEGAGVTKMSQHDLGLKIEHLGIITSKSFQRYSPKTDTLKKVKSRDGKYFYKVEK